MASSPSGAVSGEELAEPQGPLRLPRPAYDGASIVNIAPTVIQSLGVSVPADRPPLAPPLRAALDPWSGGRSEGTTVVLLVDGFGWRGFSEAASASTDRRVPRWRSHARPITTVYPTTTAAALVSLSTGTPPARHGMAGYRLFLPSYGVVADLLKMAAFGVAPPESLIGPAWTPRVVSAVPAIFGLLPGSVGISRAAFEGTGLTRILYEGAEYLPYATASDLAHQLVTALGRPRPPRLLYAYWDELDTVHHLRGPERSLFAFELERLAQMASFVAHAVDPGRARSTTLLVTGDHGQVLSQVDRQIYVDALPDLIAEMARPMAGDRRGGYFAARPGRRAELRAALERHLPVGARVVDMNDALEGGLFGPPPWHSEIRDRLGDFLALVPPTYGLVQQMPGSTPPRRHLIGSHGGLDPAELLVPLIAGPLAEFADA